MTENIAIPVLDKFAKRTLVFLHIITFLKVFGFLAISESAGVNKVFKVIMGLLMTLLILVITRKMIKKGYVFQFKYINILSLIFYMIYFLLGVISITWAGDYLFSMIQIFRDIDLLLYAFLFLRVVRAFNSKNKTTYDLSSFLVFAIFFNALYFFQGNFLNPDKFIRLTHGLTVARLGGLIMNPNELGMLCSLGGACVLLQFKSKTPKWLLFIMLGINLYTMFLTGSRSTLIGFILVLGVYTLISDNKVLKIGMVLVMFIGAPIMLKEVVFSEEKGGVDEVMSMTGRLPFWDALLNEALPKEPLLGYGFMNIYYTKYFQGKNTYPASMTHNTFVQVIMNLGLIGITIVFFQMVFVIRALIRSQDIREKHVFLFIFIPIFINSLTEFGIFGETNYGILFYQLIFLSLVLRPLEEAKEEFDLLPA